MINVAGFAREGSGEKNVYGVKREWDEEPDLQDVEMKEASHESDHKDVKLGREFLASGLDKEVIPNQLSYGPQEVQRKGDKNTFYCEVRTRLIYNFLSVNSIKLKVCYVELNSLETMRSHTLGSKHQKKMLALEAKQEENVRQGQPREKLPGVKPIPNPRSAKVKVPIRLQERIRQSNDPVVGLRYIKEFLAESDPEMEPHYECRLCGNKGTSNSMFSHIMGGKHRHAFAEEIGHRGSFNQRDLLKLARDNNENGSRISALMETVTSDTEYPAWPAGKAPWAVERGGSGLPPPEARASSTSTSSMTRVRTDSASGAHRRAKIGRLPPDYKPQSDEEAQKMISVGRKLMEMAVRSEHSGLSRAEQDQILGNLENILERGRK